MKGSPEFLLPAARNRNMCPVEHHVYISQGLGTNIGHLVSQMQEGDASGKRKQAAEERQDKDYSPPEEATDTPSSYDGPASRTRATSDAPEDVPELPADV